MALGVIIDTEALAKVIAAALLAGIGITTVFGLVIYGGTRFVDLRRDGRPVAAGAFAAFAVVCFAAFIAGVIYGLVIVASK